MAPDLVIEAVSPNDEVEALNQKIREYLGAGVRTVWVLFPGMRTAEVYRVDGTVSYVPPDGALDGEDVIPGFGCNLAQIMPPRVETD